MTEVLQELGTEGLRAYYLTLLLDYIHIWVTLGLCIWGIRSAWNHLKRDL